MLCKELEHPEKVHPCLDPGPSHVLRVEPSLGEGDRATINLPKALSCSRNTPEKKQSISSSGDRMLVQGGGSRMSQEKPMTGG